MSLVDAKTLEQIQTKLKELELRDKQLKKEAKILEAEKQFLQSICEHPNKRTWTHYDYGGGSDRHEHCDDCGFHATY